MKRISLLVLGLCATAWASGCCCCHGYYSHYSDCDDGVYVQREHRSRRNRHRHAKGERCDIDNGDCCGNCCDGCCDGSVGSGPSLPMTYDGAMMNGASMGGCTNCGPNQTVSGIPQNYAGTPFDPSAGWTIQSTTSTPVGNEPVMAPPSSSSGVTPITPVQPRAQGQGWAPSVNPAPVPSSGPVPPPVSYNR
jgi:hypothetical protein